MGGGTVGAAEDLPAGTVIGGLQVRVRAPLGLILRPQCRRRQGSRDVRELKKADATVV